MGKGEKEKGGKGKKRRSVHKRCFSSKLGSVDNSQSLLREEPWRQRALRFPLKTGSRCCARHWTAVHNALQLGSGMQLITHLW